MFLVQLKKTIPTPVKTWLKKHILGISAPYPADSAGVTDQAKQTIKQEIDRYLSGSTPNVHVGLVQHELKDSSSHSDKPIFKDFFLGYVRLLESNDKIALHKLQDEHPVLCNVCDRLYSYLSFCDRVKSPVAGVLRRLCYFAFPFMNSCQASQIYSYRDSLPRVGIFVHVNSAPRDFLTDALEGHFQLELVDTESIITKTWNNRSYEYLSTLKEYVSEAIDELPKDFVSQFPSRDWLIQQVSYHAQSQIGLKKLLERKAWDLVVIGSTESPLCLSLVDIPPQARPPVILLNHGLPFGDPFADLFLGADYVLARGSADREYFLDLGFRPDKIIEVGSLTKEAFPNANILRIKRRESRLSLDLDDHTPVLIYALPYDLFTFESRSVEQVTELMIASFIALSQRQNIKDPILYLKYHPAPTDDPYFSFSRQQYPLERLFELSQYGYSVRHIKDLTAYLPAADCFIAHESTVLGEALYAGVPTVSLNFQKGAAKPMLGLSSYKEPTAQSFLNVYDSTETIADAIYKALLSPREFAWESCATAWQHVFDCPRTEGMVRLLKLASTLCRQAPALMPGCIEECGGGGNPRRTDLKNLVLKGEVSLEPDKLSSPSSSQTCTPHSPPEARRRQR